MEKCPLLTQNGNTVHRYSIISRPVLSEMWRTFAARWSLFGMKGVLKRAPTCWLIVGSGADSAKTKG
jgi:hypothetical protein